MLWGKHVWRCVGCWCITRGFWFENAESDWKLWSLCCFNLFFADGFVSSALVLSSMSQTNNRTCRRRNRPPPQLHALRPCWSKCTALVPWLQNEIQEWKRTLLSKSTEFKKINLWAKVTQLDNVGLVNASNILKCFVAWNVEVTSWPGCCSLNSSLCSASQTQEMKRSKVIGQEVQT